MLPGPHHDLPQAGCNSYGYGPWDYNLEYLEVGERK